MQKDDTRTIIFAAVVCVIVSLLLATTYAALKDRQAANAENDRRKNVLSAFGEDTEKITAEQIQETFDAHIDEIFLDAEFQPIDGLTRENITEFDGGKYTVDMVDGKDTAPYPLYRWFKDKNAAEKEIVYYCYPQNGKGLWSTVYSYIALEANCTDIQGATFFGHAETPGLGGECSKDWFQDNFDTKKIGINEDGEVNFEVVKGKVAARFPGGNDFAVDGMGGATITGDGIERFIQEEYAKYYNYFEQIKN